MMYQYMDGTKLWYKDNSQCLHREDGPACEYPNGTEKWYQYGLLHREDGPAIEYANGNKYWFINDKLIDSEVEFLKIIKLKAFW